MIDIIPQMGYNMNTYFMNGEMIMLDVLTRAGCFIAIIIAGYVLRKVNFFKEGDFAVLSKITLKITLPAARTSEITRLIRSSNSPRYFEPAIIPDKSSVKSLFSFIVSGTLP